MHSSLRNYQKERKLGEGTYGVVYKAIDLRTQERVALKKIRVDYESQGIPATSIREIALLKSLDHPNIVKAKEVINENGKVTLVMEFLDYDLHCWLRTLKGKPSLKTVKTYAYQIIAGVCYCHCHRVMHRDLKPSNILLNQYGIVKICDFGLARTFTVPMRVYSHEIVTTWYRPPEVLMGDSHTGYGTSVDLWSIGCIIAEMELKKPLFAGDSDLDQLFAIFKVLGTPTEETFPGMSTYPLFSETFPKWPGKSWEEILPDTDPQLKDLIAKLLTYDPVERITAKDALQHPFFADIPEDIITLCRPKELDLGL